MNFSCLAANRARQRPDEHVKGRPAQEVVRHSSVFRSQSWQVLRLARQTLTESLTVAAGGAALGLLLAVWTNRLLVRTMPAIPHLDFVTVSMSLNWRVIAFSVAAAFASAALFSLSPAIEQSKVDLTPALKNESDGLGRMRQRDVYVVAQVALSLVLLIAATLLVRALSRSQSRP